MSGMASVSLSKWRDWCVALSTALSLCWLSYSVGSLTGLALSLCWLAHCVDSLTGLALSLCWLAHSVGSLVLPLDALLLYQCLCVHVLIRECGFAGAWSVHEAIGNPVCDRGCQEKYLYQWVSGRNRTRDFLTLLALSLC